MYRDAFKLDERKNDKYAFQSWLGVEPERRISKEGFENAQVAQPASNSANITKRASATADSD